MDAVTEVELSESIHMHKDSGWTIDVNRQSTGLR